MQWHCPHWSAKAQLSAAFNPAISDGDARSATATWSKNSSSGSRMTSSLWSSSARQRRIAALFSELSFPDAFESVFSRDWVSNISEDAAVCTSASEYSAPVISFKALWTCLISMESIFESTRDALARTSNKTSSKRAFVSLSHHDLISCFSKS